MQGTAGTRSGMAILGDTRGCRKRVAGRRGPTGRWILYASARAIASVARESLLPRACAYTDMVTLLLEWPSL